MASFLHPEDGSNAETLVNLSNILVPREKLTSSISLRSYQKLIIQVVYKIKGNIKMITIIK